MTNCKGTAFVVFGKEFPGLDMCGQNVDLLIADKTFRQHAEASFIELDSLVGPGSVYEASAFLEKLSHMKLADDTRISKSMLHKGYELWWIHYDDLFFYFCLPYTQYKNLLAYLTQFKNVYFYRPPYKTLFAYYVQAYGGKAHLLPESDFKSPSFLPFGIFVQIVLTLVSLPVLILQRRRAVIFTGDKFEKDRDYDFRMKFIYKELRQRHIRFVEYIRSLESWKTVLQHALIRRRPIIYSESLIFLGRFFSILSGGRRRVRRELEAYQLSSSINPEVRFKCLVAAHYLRNVTDDIWSIRIMRCILRCIGVRAAAIDKASSRNFHTVLGCKLNGIPTVGILHGVASRYSTPYDFMSGFDGEKMLSVDYYGLWSKWWKEFYIKNSQAYKSDQLYVSGPMRPLMENLGGVHPSSPHDAIRVLFISEQAAEPSEVVPYLKELFRHKEISCTIKFRHYRDGFEEWILGNEPQLLQSVAVSIVRGPMQEAIHNSDVVVGSYSTAALEALLQLKVPLFMHTRKWGDYYSMAESSGTRRFLVENPEELVMRIKEARVVSKELLMKLREQYFGDPHKNGSIWVVDQLSQHII